MNLMKNLIFWIRNKLRKIEFKFNYVSVTIVSGKVKISINKFSILLPRWFYYNRYLNGKTTGAEPKNILAIINFDQSVFQSAGKWRKK